VLLSDRNEVHLPLCTAVYPDVCGDGATHFGHTLLQARLQRLCHRHALERAAGTTAAAVALELKNYLLSLSGSLHLVASERGVRTGIDGGTVWVEVSVEGSVNLPPVRVTIEL
jgi:hypothetical protein